MSNSRPLLNLDGSQGGGQLLRTSLSLSMITGTPFRMANIRAQRKKPGLQRQHLTCVLAATEISQATTTGAELGSTELTFHPNTIRGGNYAFAIGNAGSTSLLLQTLLLPLMFANQPSTLELSGGTHNPLAPPFEFIQQVYLPRLHAMGATLATRLVESGFAPAGGGSIITQIHPIEKLAPFDWTSRGPLQSLNVVAISRNLPPTIAQRMLNRAQNLLPSASCSLDLRDHGPGQGIALRITAEHDRFQEQFSAIGEFGVRAEHLAKRASNQMQRFLHANACVGHHLADQLLLPMALAGSGCFTCTHADPHVTSSIPIIEAFLPVQFTIAADAKNLTTISCQSRASTI